MTSIPFSKYHGAGNDFIMIDDREGRYDSLFSTEQIAHLCHRRFGVGADGMILLQRGDEGADFFMKYYNADGRTSSFCGNGGRCIVAFAAALGVHDGKCDFRGTDGGHSGEIHANGEVTISMSDVPTIHAINDHAVVLDTGSPHYVAFVEEVTAVDVFSEGRAIRLSDAYKAHGINVNFVELAGTGELHVRTYERGVEDETYACGTGVVAAAIAASFRQYGDETSWLVHAKGGDLRVSFVREGPGVYSAVKLTGQAVEVYSGFLGLGFRV